MLVLKVYILLMLLSTDITVVVILSNVQTDLSLRVRREVKSFEEDEERDYCRGIRSQVNIAPSLIYTLDVCSFIDNSSHRKCNCSFNFHVSCGCSCDVAV